jgi:hypothetical protein
VVSHHLAGLRRHSLRCRSYRETTLSGNIAESRGLVASRCRSWGSSRFWPGPPVARCRRRSRDAFLPLEGFSPFSAVPCHHGLLPSCRSLAALLEPPGFALPLPPFNPRHAVSVDFKALLREWVCTIVRRFRPPMVCPPVGFWFPSKVLRSRASAFAVIRDERASRLRGQSRRSSRCTLQWALSPHIPSPPCGGPDARCSGVPCLARSRVFDWEARPTPCRQGWLERMLPSRS